MSGASTYIYIVKLKVQVRVQANFLAYILLITTVFFLFLVQYLPLIIRLMQVGAMITSHHHCRIRIVVLTLEK